MISDLVEKLFRNCTRGAEYPEQGALFDGLPERFGERRFSGLAATQYAGTSNKMDGATDLGRWDGAMQVFWPERGGLNVLYSPNGGIPLALGTIKSQRYPPGTKEWKPNTNYDPGDTVGRKGKLYFTDIGGLSGATEPMHISGTVSDGGVPWTYDAEYAYSYTAPIPCVSLCLNDFRDGEASWDDYAEAGRTADGGTHLGRESNAFQDGSLVLNFPTDMTPPGAVMNYWHRSGKSFGKPANPSTCVHGYADEDANAQPTAAIHVVGKNAIMAGGYYSKLFSRAEHAFGWFNDAKQVVAMLYSLATNNADRIAAVFVNRAWNLYCAGALMASDEAAAGGPPTDRVRRIAYPGAGYAELRAQNIANSACDLLLSGGNGGKLRMGNFVPYAGTATITGYFEVRDHATGQVRKLLCGEPS